MDPINGMPPFKERYPELFSICNNPECIVEKFWHIVENIFFRRRLTPDLSEQWGVMRDTVNTLPLTNNNDMVTWGLNRNGNFSTKSMYEELEKRISGCDLRWVWKAKTPLKIMIFLRQLSRDAALTRDVISRRN